MPKWGFDEVTPNRFDPGETTLSLIFESSSSLAKEPLQNAVDRISETNKNLEGRIQIDIIEFSGDQKQEVLQELDWSNLKKHIAAVQRTSSEAYAARLNKSVDRVESDAALRFLAISDFGTLGLPGDDFNRENHIYRLTRSAHVTDANQKNRDGSHGLGKGVFWKYSGLSSVLFYSLTCKDDVQNDPDPLKQMALLEQKELEHRFIGQSTLANHVIDGTEFMQAGFFGDIKSTEKGDATVSAWGESRLIDLLGIKREPKIGNTGTTVLVLDFNDPSSEEQLAGGEELSQLEKSASKWFWPALCRKKNDGTASIDICFRYLRNGEIIEEIEPDLEPYQGFIETMMEDGHSGSISNIGDVVAEEISVETPIAIKQLESQTSCNANMQVKVKSILENSVNDDLYDRVALLRRRTMVVDYEKVNSKLDEKTGLIGVVLAGRALGRAEADVKLHDFLRDMEPPAHDSWDTFKDKMNLYPKGAASKRGKIIQAYRDTLKRLGTIKRETKDQSVKALSQMLRFKGMGRETKTYKIQSSNLRLSKDTQNNSATLNFDLFCNALEETSEWTAGLKIKIKGISEPLNLISYSPNDEDTGVIEAKVTGENELIIKFADEERMFMSLSFDWPEYLNISEQLAVDLLARYVK